MTVACGEVSQVMLLSGCSSAEQHGGGGGGGGAEAAEGSQSSLQQDKKAQTTLFAQRALQERRLKPPDQVIACPRCQSLNTKFCYYNNYSLTQPRHFCKNCRRYWTAGGTLRNVPVGGGCRKNKRAKQRSTDLSSVLSSVESPVAALRSDAAGSALHPAYNPSSASTSTGYYDHQYEDATKIALARVQHSIRAGPSGVSQSSEGISSNGHVSAFHVAHGSHSAGMSHGAQSSFEAPSIISLGYYQPPPKQEVVMANGDLSAIFESPTYRAAAAAAAAAGGAPALGEGGIPYNIDLEALNNIDPMDAQWRLHQHAHQAAQKQAIWGGGKDEQNQRESGGGGRQQQQQQSLNNGDEKGLIESLRQSKGKSAITLSPPGSHEQSKPEVSRPLNAPAWQQPQSGSEGLQYEPTQESAFWSNQTWAPLDIHAMNPGTNSQMI